MANHVFIYDFGRALRHENKASLAFDEKRRERKRGRVEEAGTPRKEVEAKTTGKIGFKNRIYLKRKKRTCSKTTIQLEVHLH